MVADRFDLQSEPRARWFHYLALSLFANLVIANLIQPKPDSISLPTDSQIKINLMSIAAPAPKPEPIKTMMPPLPPKPVIKEKKIVTKKQAPKKIAKIKPEPKPQKTIEPKPVIKKTEIVKQQITKPIPQKPERDNEIKKPVETKETNYPTRIETVALAPAVGKELSTVVQDAKYRKQTPPRYPRRALELGQQGNVTLHALVKPDGLPSELKIMKSSGHSLLDKAALAAVRKWEFEPTNKNGTAVTSWVRVPIEFVIQ